MKLIKDTPFEAGWLVWEAKKREHMLTVAVKATYDLPKRGLATLAAEQPFVTGDLYVDDDVEKGLRWSSDLEPLKPTGECFVVGSFHAPRMQPVERSLARLRVGAIEKSVAVTGDRLWAGRKPGPPAPFTEMPLSWERCFGGPGRPDNPAGRGDAPDPETGEVQLPNIEDARATIEGGTRSPKSVGLAPMPRAFPARLRHAGTYGARWQAAHYPAYAEDLDYRLFMAAPEDQRASGFFHGDEEVELRHLHPIHPEVFARLPGHRAKAFVGQGGALTEIGLRLDTIAIDADAGTATLVWRGVTPTHDPRLSHLDHLFVVHERARDRASLAELTERYAEAVEAAKDPEAEPETAPEADPGAKWAHLDQAMTLRSDDGLRAALDAEIARRTGEAKAAAFRPMFETALGIASEEHEEALDAEMAAALDEMGDDEPDPRREKVRDAIRSGESCAGWDLSGLDLSGVDLSGGDFTDAILVDVNLSGAHAAGARFDGATLSRAELSEARFSNVTFVAANLTPVRAERVRFADCDLGEVAAKESYFRGAMFSRCRLGSAELGESDFSESLFEESELDATDFSLACLERARFLRSRLADVWMEGVRAAGAVFDGCDASLLRGSEEADFSNTSFKGGTLDGARFGTSNLRGAKLGKASLERADFRGAMLVEASLFGCVLRHACFDDASLVAASLVQSDLYRASFVRANLTRADLRGASLFQADLLDARIEGTRLESANLDGTRLA